MKAGVTSTLLAVILALIPCLPASAASNETAITITMNTTAVIEIELSVTNWTIGAVEPNKSYLTDPPIEWTTLKNKGNVAVNTFIMGENATCVGNGSYKWILSGNRTNGEDIYALEFRVSGDTERSYFPVSTTKGQLWPWYGDGTSLAPNATKQFGLRLLTPTSFQGDKQMQTHIIVSAVAA